MYGYLVLLIHSSSSGSLASILITHPYSVQYGYFARIPLIPLVSSFVGRSLLGDILIILHIRPSKL